MPSVHNPDQHMWALRQLISQNRKKIGFLIGAGAPAGVRLLGNSPLIPAIEELTVKVLANLDQAYAPGIAGLIADIGKEKPNIEELLSRVRSVSGVIGTHQLHGLNGEQYSELGKSICKNIGTLVGKDLPQGQNAYTSLVSWVSGADRKCPVEIFTTNYDLLFEQAFERAKIPYFDGFVGASTSFFDGSTVASNDLPARWSRLWKLHGSLGWEVTPSGDVTRRPGSDAPYCVFPEHLKYEQTAKAPYSALFDRLRAFLSEPDVLLIVSGFSFADAHITARISESLVANPAASVFAFQFKNLDEEPFAATLASQRANVSVYARDKAVVNTITAPWRTGEPPTKNWGPIQETYWKRPEPDAPGEFLLGDFGRLAPFLAAARTEQGSLTSEHALSAAAQTPTAMPEAQQIT
ncbi:SIR2 family protein [Phenylobacterium sp.]|uniref:SIR2 family protein n=1 Tax=Phenylobacterium sp. TaxID=1871053 RepID=UPI0035AF369B